MLRATDRPRRVNRHEDRRLAPLRRVRHRLLIGLGLLLAVGGVLPRLLSLTGAAAWILNQTIGQRPGSLSVGDVHLGWLRPVQIDQLKLLGDDRKSLAAIKSLRTERPLWKLVTSPEQLGVVHVQQPEVRVEVRAGGSNWEDYLASWPVSSSSRRMQCQIQIHRGTVAVADPDGRVDQIRDLEAWLDMPASNASAITFAAQFAHAPTDGNVIGQVQVQGSWQADAPGGPRAKLDADLDSFPLDLSHYVALRYDQPGSVRGAASGKCQMQFRIGADLPIQDLATEFTFANLEVDVPPRRGEPYGAPAASEVLRFSTAKVELKVTERDGRIVVERWDVASPVLSAALSGQLHLARLAPSTLWTAVTQPPFVLRGQVDLAALAEQAPRAMRLRDDVRLSSGTLSWEIVHQPPDLRSRRLEGRIQARDLAARRGDETLRLDDVIEINFQLGVDRQGPFAERLTARAPFLQLSAQGRLQEGRVDGESDLSRLTQELGQYVDFGDLQLAGQLSGHARWETTSERGWQVEGQMRADNLHVAGASGEPWKDAHLQASFQGTGRFKGWQLAELSTASLDCSSGTDDLSARLTSPIGQPLSAKQWPLEVRLRGDLAQWRSRATWFGQGTLPRVAGQVDLRAKLDASPSAVRVSPLEASLRDLEIVLAWDAAGRQNELATGSTVAPAQATVRTITEPSLELAADAVYHIANRQLVCESATLASTSASAKAESLRLDWMPSPRVEGTVHFRGDLEKLWQGLDLDGDARAIGQWVGQARLLPADDGCTIEASSKVAGFQWQRRAERAEDVPGDTSADYRTLWHEPQVQVSLSGSWPATENRLHIHSATCQTESFAVHLAGTVDTSQPFLVDVQGGSNLNWEPLTMRLRPWLGDDIRLAGAVEKPFRLKGPVTYPTAAAARGSIVPKELEGEAGIGWQSVQAYGVTGGAGALRARLRNRTLAVEPFEIPVSQGAIRLAPQIELFGPLRLVLAKGPVIQQVSITPEMCQRWLKYVAPIVAEATEAEGRVSLQLARAELPLRAPRTASAGGSMTIHQAHIGPGPLARELLTLAQTINTLVDPGRGGDRSQDAKTRWIELPEQAVSFRVENGQVAHQNLTMQIGDVTIRTRGWVGFDQRLGLVADVPVLDRWVANKPYLAALRGQTLSIPVHGTLQQPALDQRALESLAQQAARGAAQGILQQEVQRQLERLLFRK